MAARGGLLTTIAARPWSSVGENTRAVREHTASLAFSTWNMLSTPEKSFSLIGEAHLEMHDAQLVFTRVTFLAQKAGARWGVMTGIPELLTSMGSMFPLRNLRR